MLKNEHVSAICMCESAHGADTLTSELSRNPIRDHPGHNLDEQFLEKFEVGVVVDRLFGSWVSWMQKC